MSRFDSQNLLVFQIPKTEIHNRTLVEIFNIDCDFFENVEYFRDDTKELGFQDESERCAEEIYNKHKDIKDPKKQLQKMMDDVGGYSNGIAGFIVGNGTYSGDYKIEIEEVGDVFVVIIAYIGS